MLSLYDMINQSFLLTKTNDVTEGEVYRANKNAFYYCNVAVLRQNKSSFR